MLTDNPVLMNNAWNSLSKRWGNPAVATLIFLVITGVAGFIPYLGWLAGVVIGGPLTLGYIAFTVAHMDGTPGNSIDTVFSGFNNFLNAFIAQLLMGIFVFLWSLLLFIPGIMATYSYAMTFFIMNDNPEISGQEAITASKNLMRGNRWKLFCLDLRFMGWWILCILTLGILSLWIMPYIYTARAMFYRDLLAEKQAVADRRPLSAIAGFYHTDFDPPQSPF